MADASLELYGGTALEWILDGDEVRLEVDEAVVRELEAMLDAWLRASDAEWLRPLRCRRALARPANSAPRSRARLTHPLSRVVSRDGRPGFAGVYQRRSD